MLKLRLRKFLVVGLCVLLNAGSALPVLAADTTPPQVVVSSPANHATVSGVVTLTASASDDTGVSRVDYYFDGGSRLIGSSFTAPYAVDWNTVYAPNGSQTIVVVAYDAAGNYGWNTSLVTVMNEDAVFPTTSFVTPQNGASVTSPVSVTFNAADNVGLQIAYIQVDNGSAVARWDFPTQTSFTASLNLSNGSHVISATAKDFVGNQTTASITVTVTPPNTPPTVTVTSPANGAQVSDLIVPITASASDDVSVSFVEFYADGVLVGTDDVAPYTASWNTAGIAMGSSHTLMAKAYDSQGASATDQVTVTVVDITAPTVSLTSPANGAHVSGVVTFTASAADNRGVERVEFYRGGVLLGTDSSAPYAVDWDSSTVVPGNYSVYAVAYDTSGNSMISASHAIVVDDVTAPAVAITFPADGGTVGRNKTVTITANASDNVGVSRVEFYVNGVLQCSDTAAAYSCAWRVPSPRGVAYNLQAAAYDAAGNLRLSTPVQVISQ